MTAAVKIAQGQSVNFNISQINNKTDSSQGSFSSALDAIKPKLDSPQNSINIEHKTPQKTMDNKSGNNNDQVSQGEVINTKDSNKSEIKQVSSHPNTEAEANSEQLSDAKVEVIMTKDSMNNLASELNQVLDIATPEMINSTLEIIKEDTGQVIDLSAELKQNLSVETSKSSISEVTNYNMFTEIQPSIIQTSTQVEFGAITNTIEKADVTPKTSELNLAALGTNIESIEEFDFKNPLVILQSLDNEYAEGAVSSEIEVEISGIRTEDEKDDNILSIENTGIIAPVIINQQDFQKPITSINDNIVVANDVVAEEAVIAAPPAINTQKTKTSTIPTTSNEENSVLDYQAGEVKIDKDNSLFNETFAKSNKEGFQPEINQEQLAPQEQFTDKLTVDDFKTPSEIKYNIAPKENLTPTKDMTPGDQISLNIRQALNTGKQSMTVSLSPEHLGKVEIKLEISEGVIKEIKILAHKDETLKAILKDSQILEQTVREVLKSDAQLSFSYRQDNGEGLFQEQKNESQGTPEVASKTYTALKATLDPTAGNAIITEDHVNYTV